MKIELSEGGKNRYIDKSPRWHMEGDDYATAIIAGGEMTAYEEEGVVRLLYLGYRATGFADMAEARKTAPEFACQVLDLLKQRVVDFPPEGDKPRRLDDSSDCTP
jgi:hypothetical protein